MQRVIGAIILGLTITSPVAAQTPNVQQLLQGLTTGNQTQDQALRDAFERGYQKAGKTRPECGVLIDGGVTPPPAGMQTSMETAAMGSTRVDAISPTTTAEREITTVDPL